MSPNNALHSDGPRVARPAGERGHRMSIRIIAATVAALGIAGCPMTGTENAGDAKEMKLAFDFTDGNPAVLLKKLNNVDVTRKQLIESGVTPKIVMERSAATLHTSRRPTLRPWRRGTAPPRSRSPPSCAR